MTARKGLSSHGEAANPGPSPEGELRPDGTLKSRWDWVNELHEAAKLVDWEDTCDYWDNDDVCRLCGRRIEPSPLFTDASDIGPTCSRCQFDDDGSEL